MAARRAHRREKPSVGRTLRYYAIMAIYVVVAMVFTYFLIQWALGQVVNTAVDVMKATPTTK